MGVEQPTDAEITSILGAARTICIIGASPDPLRPSHSVMAFLQDRGHRTIPVNPHCAGLTINGERVYGGLTEVPEPVEMIDIFRRSVAAGAVVDEAIAERQRLGLLAVWMQLGVRDDGAAARAVAAGLAVVMDRCPVIEYRRLSLPAIGRRI